MRRFMSTMLIAVSLLIGTLSLSGCLVAPRDHGHAVRHDGPDHHHDQNRDRDRDRDGNHQH